MALSSNPSTKNKEINKILSCPRGHMPIIPEIGVDEAGGWAIYSRPA
jgi:hypothetical protein